MWVGAYRLRIVISGVLCFSTVCFEIECSRNRPQRAFAAFRALLPNESTYYLAVSALAASYFTGIDIAI